MLEEKLGRREREDDCLVTLLLELGGVVDLLDADLELLGRLCVTDLLDVLGALELEDLCGAGLDCGAERVDARLLDELLEACGLLLLLDELLETCGLLCLVDEDDLLRDVFDFPLASPGWNKRTSIAKVMRINFLTLILLLVAFIMCLLSFCPVRRPKG